MMDKRSYRSLMKKAQEDPLHEFDMLLDTIHDNAEFMLKAKKTPTADFDKYVRDLETQVKDLRKKWDLMCTTPAD